MFENFIPLSGDPILQLMKLYQSDLRKDKIDVGVGVFKDEAGNTPIMRAVSLAEKRLHDTQTTKSYVGLAGNAEFNVAMLDLVFTDSVEKTRLRAVQTPGGSGALRICADMLKETGTKTMWVSDPTWGNHAPIFKAAGLSVKTYPYFDRNNKTVDEEKMLDALAKLGKNDVVLLHGCCHNPTGANLSNNAWDNIAELAAKNGFFPFFDLAYQGFGDGLKEDTYSVRKVATSVPELIVTSSCSKNFGLYRDRVGCAMVMGENTNSAALAEGYLKNVTRVTYSMPPDHGAATVAIILNDLALREMWERELTDMRARIIKLRQNLANQLAVITDTNEWDFIAIHRGMFSLLCLNKAQTDALINEHSIYIVDGGRVNIAGLKDNEQVERFAKSLAEVTR